MKNDTVIPKEDPSIVIETSHSEHTMRIFTKEVWTFREKYGRTILVLIFMVACILLIYLNLDDTAFGVSIAFLVVIVSVTAFFARRKPVEKFIKNTVQWLKEGKQRFYFFDDFLKITFISPDRKSETMLYYQGIKTVFLSDRFLYIPSDSVRRDRFQLDLSKIEIGNKESLINLLTINQIEIKHLKSAKIKERVLPQRIAPQKLISNKKMYFTFLSLFVLSIIGIIIMAIHFDIIIQELGSMYHSRTSMGIMHIHLSWLLITFLMIGLIVFLKKRNYQSKLFVWSYIIMPIILLATTSVALVTPLMTENMYKKDYSAVVQIFSEANITLPADGLIVSVSPFNVYDADALAMLPYAVEHRILFTDDTQIVAFNFEIENSNLWQTQLTLEMQSVLNHVVKIKSGDYYLLYNATSDDYNAMPQLIGINHLYYFIYDIDTSTVVVYEIYVKKN